MILILMQLFPKMHTDKIHPPDRLDYITPHTPISHPFPGKVVYFLWVKLGQPVWQKGVALVAPHFM